MEIIDFVWLTGLFLASFILSTVIIRVGIPRLHATSSAPSDPPGQLPDSSSTAIFDLRATGFWIGFCETFLIFVLVYSGELSAMAIIIGAKEFVRNEKIQQNPSYYLLGTLANLVVAVLFAMIGRAIVSAS